MNAKVSLWFGCMSLVALAAYPLADDKSSHKRQAQLVAPRAERPAAAATTPASNSPLLVISKSGVKGSRLRRGQMGLFPCFDRCAR